MVVSIVSTIILIILMIAMWFFLMSISEHKFEVIVYSIANLAVFIILILVVKWLKN